MKKPRSLRTLIIVTKLFLVIGSFVFLQSCQNEETLEELNSEESTDTSIQNGSVTQEFAYIGKSGILKEVLYDNQTITVEEIDGKYILEGDIIITPQENTNDAKSTGRRNGDRRWPNYTVPYTIDSSIPNQERITNAIAHWESNTSLRFVKYTGTNVLFDSFVFFKRGDGCSSPVGRQGGPQIITLSDRCSTGNTIHEIGHAIGLWHEQSRSDRNEYLTINYNNIKAGKDHNFKTYLQRGQDGLDLTSTLDFDSLMMYGPCFFAKACGEKDNCFCDPSEATITKKDGSSYFITARELSRGDIQGINKMYPKKFSVNRWATRQGGFWSAQKWMSGDFNGDGRQDYAKVFNDGGNASIDIHISNGSSFSIQRWATKQGGFWDAQKWVVGDFNNDGKDDMAKAFNDGGNASIDVHISNGRNFSIKRWATRQGGFSNDQKWVSGDFNGDGKDDMAKAFNDGGNISIDTHISNGSSFSKRRWATRQGGFANAQNWITGDFNGDGKDDMAKAFNDRGNISIDTHVSNGSSFSIRRWATRQGEFVSTIRCIVGDFNNDGKDDIAKTFNDGGYISIDIHASSGSNFNIQRWATKQSGYANSQKWASGDFNGDGKNDLVKVTSDNNSATIDTHLTL
ncbi:M12 family metallopeptidase [Aquimarina sp. BL5]|uniref:M12 family metallopeptidase n=1 Tax=Aquimarina sp. BL5 TaxID=1714860 RepID=UPI001314A0EE|nr:M12 family metallopeptidase [Aquimarina sp. BL5]